MRYKNESFDISEFNTRYVNDLEVTLNMVNEICKELNEKKWLTALAYGNTCLYIYIENEKPIWCGENIESID